jgi:putative membrane protein
MKEYENVNFLVDLIKGVFVGIANVIPGVSGGTMAVSFGIYDKLLNAISSLLKSFKKSFFTLLPIILGMAIGIVGFTYIIPWLLANFPFATSCAFTGLIIGGIPAILRSLKDGWQSEEKKSLLVNILVFLILLAVAMAMVFLNGDSESGIALTASAGMLVKIFFIASATMVIPGVSGSLVLMILGYYFGVINSVKQFVEALRALNLQGMLNQLFILIPFAIGCVLGIFFISKLISYLLKHFASATFSGIFALVASSPISIFYKVNQEYSMNGTSVVSIIVGVVLLVACVALTLFMEKLGAPESTVSES